MFINLAVHSLHLSDRLDLAHDEETERFKVVRIKAGYSEEQGRIEFDNGFVFAHESNLKKDEKPVGCELSVLVAHTDKQVRDSTLYWRGETSDPDGIANLGSFLSAHCFVTKEQFDDLIANMRGGLRLEWVELLLERESFFQTGDEEPDERVLAFGLEPDGSVLTWRTEHGSKVKITSVEFVFEGNTEQVERDTEEKPGAGVNNQLDEIRKTLLVITGVIVVATIANLFG